MKIIKRLVPTSKYKYKCPHSMKPEGITIHNTANDANPANEIKYMTTNNNEVSYHFAAGYGDVIQGIPLDRNAWHAGDGGSGYGNRKTIGIEICYSKSGGSKFTRAEKVSAKLVAQLMVKYGWKKSDLGGKRINTHKYRSGKNCPHRTLPHMKKFWDMCAKEYDLLKKPATKPAKKYPRYKIKVSSLTVRSGAGTKYKKVTAYKKGTIVNITQTKKNGSTPWGKLQNGKGWVSLLSAYCTKLSG
jgi:N-acetylmuramoyl-L-alanine amidase CwlA